MFDWYPVIKDYYNLGFYNNDTMKIFVGAKYITPEQYKEITKNDYVA
ncbi:XkdX family protein [Metabacillus fastidiosus]